MAGRLFDAAARFVRRSPELSKLVLVRDHAGEIVRNFPMEFRSLGDQPAIGLVINPGAGRSVLRPAPEFTLDCHYDLSVEHRPIRLYETIDARFILEDFFAKLQLFSGVAA